VEEIAGHTLRMYTDKDGLVVFDYLTVVVKPADIAFAQSKVRLGRVNGCVRNKPELPIVCRQRY
jgi:hypothetical protein